MAGSTYLFLALCFFLDYIIFSYIIYLGITPQSVSEDITDWGNYSMCVGALFTFVSLVLVYFTYREQSEAYRKQSEVNQQQLDKIQQQFELSQKEAQISNKMFFDSTFFNLLMFKGRFIWSVFLINIMKKMGKWCFL